jgi:hypothetical protein
MHDELYRFRFHRNCPAREVEETLRLAVLGAECLHGTSRVRLDASYCSDPEKNVCVIDAGTDVGRDIVRLFTGFAIREFGEEAFSVRRIENKACACEKTEVPA